VFKLTVDPDQIREARWPLIVGVTAASIALTTLAVYAVLGTDLLTPLHEATDGWLHPTFLINVVLMALLVVGLMFLAGRLRPRDVGLTTSSLRVGVLVTLGLWGASQLIGLVVNLILTGSIQLDTLWHERGTGFIFGSLIAQVFGNALQEEIVYRGFLLNQLVLKLRRLVKRPGVAIAAALLVSQAVFALMHIPVRLLYGFTAAELPMILLMPLLLGLFFSLVYHRTGNLFIAVGVHTLNNIPLALFTSQNLATGVILVLSLLLLVIWPRLSGQPAGQRALTAA